MNIDIMVGSVLGASEYVAEALQNMLQEQGHQTTCHFAPSIKHINVNNVLLVVTSTHGAGELPENIQGFAKDLQNTDLSGFKVVIIGLGDSSYDTFCEGSIIIETIVNEAGAKLILPVYQIDVLHHPIPEDIAVEWLNNNLGKLSEG